MKIQEILQKQGEIYKDLPSNKTVQNYNETIEKPEPVRLVEYKDYQISEKEYKAIKGLEKLLNKEPVVGEPEYIYNFEILINNSQVTYLRIVRGGLTKIPEEISFLPNLQELSLLDNQITEIKNLDNLTNLQKLSLSSNQIQKLENLDNLPNLQTLDLGNNQITEIKNLDKLTNLQGLHLGWNNISEIKNLNKLQNLKELWLYNNKISKLENLDNLTNLQALGLDLNKIKEIKKLRRRGIEVYI